MTVVLACLLIFFGTPPTYGQIPQTINYQGRLADAAGKPVADGSYIITARLYSVAKGGPALWSETQTVNTSSGLFTALLGSVTPIALSFDQAYWLGISAEGGAEMVPRRPLASVPYSLSARTVVDNAVTAAKIKPDIVSSINGVSNDGGNIELVPGSNITITPNDTDNTVTITSTGAGTGDVTAVTAGTGLSGGGTSGDVALRVAIPLVISDSMQTPLILATNRGEGHGLAGSSSAASGAGVYGSSSAGFGIIGETFSAENAAVLGTNFGCGNEGYLGSGQGGVYGWSEDSAGVKGYSLLYSGVYGVSDAQDGFGVTGEAKYGTNGAGVMGKGTYSTGVYGRSLLGRGVIGYGLANDGLMGASDAGNKAGVFAFTTNADGYGGYFVGHVNVDGPLTWTGGASKIDHPLDPANKYLQHAAVESPDMKNVYDGVITLDSAGEAIVALPDWFEALNKDFRYQLTCIGGFAPVYISEKIAGNRFKIAGGVAGLEVSWQVTGVRHDAWAEAHRIQVEVDKQGEERGKYLSPVEQGVPAALGVDFAKVQTAKPKSEGR